jgi:hypothetical protein
VGDVLCDIDCSLNGQGCLATFGFDQVREAITKAAQSGGKVLFTPKT